MRIKRQERGFTFIEMLVVAVLVSVLATIGMVSYGAAAKKTRDARRKQDSANIRVALENYRQVNGIYPDAPDCPSPNWGRSDCTSDWITGLSPDYIFELGRDPQQDKGWNGYGYHRVSDTEYELVVYLEGDDDPLANGASYGLDANAYVQEEPK